MSTQVEDFLLRLARQAGERDGRKHADHRNPDTWLVDTLWVNTRQDNPLNPEEADEYLAGYVVAMARRLREPAAKEHEDRGHWLVDGVWYTHDDEGNVILAAEREGPSPLHTFRAYGHEVQS